MTYDAQPADLKIKGNATKVKPQDHDPRGASAAIVRDRDFLQSLVAVREKDAGQGARMPYKEPDFRAGSIEKPCREDIIFYPVVLFENQRCVRAYL